MSNSSSDGSTQPVARRLAESVETVGTFKFRTTDDDEANLEALVDNGPYLTRAQAIRDALELLAEQHDDDNDDQEVRADGGIPVTTGTLDLDARPVPVTLHRVATQTGDDQYHVAFAEGAVYEFAHPPSRGSAAEWVEHHVFTHAPDPRFERLTPECERETDAPEIGTVYVDDGRLVGLALDADALAVGPPTDDHGQVESAAGVPGTSADDVRTDGGNAHGTNINSIVREQRQVAEQNGIVPDGHEWADGGDH